MRIPDNMLPLVRELAEAHFERLAGDVRILKSFRPPNHPDLVVAQQRLAAARLLDALVNHRKAAA